MHLLHYVNLRCLGTSRPIFYLEGAVGYKSKSFTFYRHQEPLTDLRLVKAVEQVKTGDVQLGILWFSLADPSPLRLLTCSITFPPLPASG